MDERTPGIRPRQTLGRLMDVMARTAFPGATTGLLLVLLAGPLGLPGQAELQWAVLLGCVFFWSLFRPGSLPPLLVFALGLLADLLGYGPIGIGVLIVLATQGLALLWRIELARQPFWLVWLAFGAVAVAAAALQWGLTSVLTLRLLPVQPALFQAAVSTGLYPLLAVLLNRAHLSVAEPALA